MRMRQYGQLYQLTFLPNVFPVNCYLVEEDNELTLIDAALPYSAKGILQAAARIGKPITRIILTHAHQDHVGALDHLKTALPHAKVMISERDAALLAGNRQLQPGEPQTPIRGGVPKKVKTNPDTLLSDGDFIGALQAIAAPGHTPGHYAYIDTRNQALIAGDALQIRGGIAVSGQYKFWFPFPAMATWNTTAALETAGKLRLLSPSLLAVGHGVVLKNPLELMDKAIEAAEKANK